MANAFYTPAKKAFLDADIDMLDNVIRVVLINTALYTFSASDEFLSDIPALARVASSAPLATKTTTAGTFDADDALASNVMGSGATISAIAVYRDGGTPATSRLIVYLDDVTGLPITPDNANVTIGWALSGIFTI